MSGTYLATTTEDDVQWLTAAGQSVGLSVEPIRYHLAQTLSPAHGALLAEPVEDAASRTTDWYAIGDGEASTLAGAPAAVRARATDTAILLLHDVKGEAARLAASPDADERVLGAMLERVSQVPDLGCVRLRGDVPIVIAWGHGRAGQSVDLATLLQPVAPVARRAAARPRPTPPKPRLGRAGAASALRFAGVFVLTAVIAFAATALLLPTRLRDMVIGEDVASLQHSIDDARVMVRQLLATCVPSAPVTRQADRGPDPVTPQIVMPDAAPNMSVVTRDTPAALPPPAAQEPQPSRQAARNERAPPASLVPTAPAAPLPSASQLLPAPRTAVAPVTAAPATTAVPTAPISSSLAPDTAAVVTPTAPLAEPAAGSKPPADQPPQPQPQPGTALARDAPPSADPQQLASDDPKPPAPDTRTTAPVTSAPQQPGESAAVAAPTETSAPGFNPQLPLHDTARQRSPRPFTQAAMQHHDLGMLQGCWALSGAFATAEKQTRTAVQVSQWRTCFSASAAGATTVSGSQLLAWADGKSCSGAVTARFGSADKLEISDAGDCLGDRTLFRIVQQCARKDDATLLCAWSADDRGVGRLRGEGLALSAAP